jgi:hypothetical protein
MWKQFLILNSAFGLIAGSSLAAQAQAPPRAPQSLLGVWVLESDQSLPNADRMVFRADRTLVLIEKGKQFPGTWKPIEGSRVQLTLSDERNRVWMLDWKVLDDGVLRLRGAHNRKDAPTFWVHPPSSSRRIAKKPVPPKPLWELPKDKDGKPICVRCERSEFGRPKKWAKQSKDGRTIACGVCRTSYVFLQSDGLPYQPVKTAKEPNKRKYSAFHKLVSREGTWQLQSERGSTPISFNATRGTAFAAGRKWLWEEVGEDHLRVTYDGEKTARDWKWELSDDRQVLLVTESILGTNPLKRKTFSLIRGLP